MSATLTRMTADQFLEEFDTRGLELIDGEIVENDMGAESGWVALNVYKALSPGVEEERLGLLFPPDFGIACWPARPDHVRKPDGMFFLRERLPSVPKGWIKVAPSIAWEVVSPHERAPLLMGKLEDYREAGIPLVWVLYPEARVIDVWKPDGTATRLGPEDTLTGEQVLPGFAARVADLFVVP